MTELIYHRYRKTRYVIRVDIAIVSFVHTMIIDDTRAVKTIIYDLDVLVQEIVPRNGFFSFH
jgi:hypothetical protein